MPYAVHAGVYYFIYERSRERVLDETKIIAMETRPGNEKRFVGGGFILFFFF